MQVVNSTENVYSGPNRTNFVFTDELGVSTVNLKIQFWVETFEYGMEALLIKGRVISNVKAALLKEGFGLPANITEVKLYDTQTTIPLSISKPA